MSSNQQRKGLRRFVAEYTDGLRSEDFRRLFNRDAARAYAVLARDQAQGEEPPGQARRFLHRAKVLFLGLSYKLSPPRRLLFGLAMLCVFLGFLQSDLSFDTGGEGSGLHVRFGLSRFYDLLAICALVYLLAVELVDRILVRDELEVARTVQRDLMPAVESPLPGWSVAHSWRTANEVGGDYYDFLPVAGGRWAIVIGDASGHGMAAGLVMAVASAAIRTAVELDPSPAAVVASVNKVLCRSGGRHAFMSLFFGLVDASGEELEYVCAGHPYPLVRRHDGAIVELGRGSYPLGLRPELALVPARVALGAGDLLLLCSDGLPEGLSSAGEAFGFERIRALLAAGGSPHAVHARVLAEFDRHRGEEPLADDLTLVVLERATVVAS